MAPSKRHNELLEMARRWITNRSFKICGVSEANFVGYLADYAAIAGMGDYEHSRYARHSGLTKRYMLRRSKDELEVKGEIDRWYVCVFEVKVSRADFLNTFGNKNTAHAKARMAPAGTAHWVVADKGVCRPEELPDFWGLLTPYGSGLTEKKMPKLNILPDSDMHAMAFDLLWLRLNFRASHYNKAKCMANKIKSIHHAILHEYPRSEIIELTRQAVRVSRFYT